MFRFENMDAFHFLWILPLLIMVGYFFHKRAHQKISEKIGLRIYPFLTKSVSPKKRQIKNILRSGTLIFFVLALARPQLGQKSEKVKSEGIEIFFLADVSESMLTEDVKPSRLDQVKVELSRLLDLLPGHKVGMIAFAGSSALLSPLTTDVSAVKMYIDSLSTNAVSSQGTNLESALNLTKESFEKGGVETDNTSRVTRVILIVSDGEDHEPGALKMAQELVKEGVRIFTVAYGTEKGGAIPVRDAMGFLKGYKKDRGGQTILSTVKGDELRAIAEAGKGSFYHASFGGDHIKNIAQDIEQLEKSEFETSVATQYEEKFQIFLIIGILLGMIELWLGERKNAFQFWKGRFEVPPS